MKVRKQLLAALLAWSLLPVSALAWGGSAEYTISPRPVAGAKAQSDWTICIYMCGTDLESGYGCATNNLIQMIEADIPEDDTVLVMTGGTREWDPDGLARRAVEEGRIAEGAFLTPDAAHTQIFEVDDAGMHLLYTYENNLAMNNMTTAAGFMEFALSYAPADKLMLSFWDHGGGPVRSSIWDEHTQKGASPPELAGLVKAVSEARGGKIDLVGFDTCLTCNLETAALLAPYASYMVASEEIEPGNGWCYHWLSESNGGPAELGKAIVDTYAQSSEAEDTWADVSGMTLAVVDLGRVPALMEAFSGMALELKARLDDPEAYAPIARQAELAVDMNRGEAGLLDLYDFAYRLRGTLKTADEVIAALGAPPGNELVGETRGETPAVIYRGVSPDFRDALGLAFYHPTLATAFDSNQEMAKVSARYRSLGLNGDHADYVDVLIHKTDALKTFQGSLYAEFDPAADCPVLTVLPTDAALALKAVSLEVSHIQKNGDGTKQSYLLGDVAVSGDWSTGRFEGVMPVEWFSLNAMPYSATDLRTDAYESYVIPAIIGGNDFVSEMTVCREFGGSRFTIASISDPTDGLDTAGRSYEPGGDAFSFRTILWNSDDDTDYLVNAPYVISPDEEGEYSFPAETVPLTFDEDSLYEVRFVAIDMKNNKYGSDPIFLSNPERLDELTIRPIWPQIFTGEPVTPRLVYLYGGTEVDKLGGRFDVTYTNNREVGTASVTVTSLEEDFPGTLSASFQIRPLAEIFSDVSYDSWYFPAANEMYTNGYMNGTGGGRFSPDSTLTRSMAVEILFRMSDQIGFSDSRFDDVRAEDYFYSAVRWGVRNGLVNGYDRTHFAPHDPITREQFMTILYRYAKGKKNFTPAQDVPMAYSDLPQLSGFAAEAAAWMTQNGIVTGYPDNTLRPKNGVTRMEATAIFARFLNSIEGS